MGSELIAGGQFGMLCPHCEEEILDGALKCKFCKEFIASPTMANPVRLENVDFDHEKGSPLQDTLFAIDQLLARINNDSQPLSSALRESFALANAAGNTEVTSWIERELDGYPDPPVGTKNKDAKNFYPEVRNRTGRLFGTFAGVNGAVMIPDPRLNFLTEVPFSQSISYLEATLRQGGEIVDIACGGEELHKLGINLSGRPMTALFVRFQRSDLEDVIAQVRGSLFRKLVRLKEDFFNRYVQELAEPNHEAAVQELKDIVKGDNEPKALTRGQRLGAWAD